MIKIIFPDGQIKEYSQGITPMDIALSISEGLARNVLAASPSSNRVFSIPRSAYVAIDNCINVQY
jgi:threonyl-tRNA synthetase